MKSVDLNSISYAHRASGASLLIAKANRLSGMLSLAPGQPLEQSALLAALAHYDMALSLLKPFDSNYATVVNWKCNVLVALRQHKEAVAWYREILRLSDETDGKTQRNATAALAEQMIKKYAGMEDEPLTQGKNNATSFDDPPYCMFAEEFCLSLAAKKFKKAHSYLAPSLQETVTVAKLKADWSEMVGRAGIGEIEVCLQQHMLEWPSRKADDIGRCYFSISASEFNEAATLVVARTPHNGYWISELEFGRP